MLISYVNITVFSLRSLLNLYKILHQTAPRYVFLGSRPNSSRPRLLLHVEERETRSSTQFPLYHSLQLFNQHSIDYASRPERVVRKGNVAVFPLFFSSHSNQIIILHHPHQLSSCIGESPFWFFPALACLKSCIVPPSFGPLFARSISAQDKKRIQSPTRVNATAWSWRLCGSLEREMKPPYPRKKKKRKRTPAA